MNLFVKPAVMGTSGNTLAASMRELFSEPPSLRGVVDHLPATVAYWDAHQVCRFVNRTYEAWLGLEARAMLGKTKQELLGPLYSAYQPYIEGALRGEVQEFERVIPDPSAPRYGLAQYVPDIVDGEVRGFYSLMTDVTQLKRAEKTLLEIERRLQLGERFAALTTLAAGIAHEINNPLTATLAHTELAIEALAEGDPDIPTLAMDLHLARDNAARVRDIVQRMKLLAQDSNAQRASIDLKEIMEQSIEIANAVIRHRATVLTDCEPSVYVEGAAAQIAQLFVHLLTNASQALPETNRAANEIRVSIRREGRLAVVEIRDNGCGIPDALQSRIFEPFFTTRPIGSGMGLGLSISSAIAESLGGQLSMTSELAKGSTFRVELPTVAPETQVPRKADAVAGAEPAAMHGPKPTRVLVIDDEPAVVKTLQRVLGRECEVSVASHGKEAIARLLDRTLPDIDVVLCDVMMPDPDGEAIYANVSERRGELAERFVFMTGGATTQRSRAFVAAVPAPVLQKPFDLKRLRAVIAARAKRADSTRVA